MAALGVVRCGQRRDRVWPAELTQGAHGRKDTGMSRIESTADVAENAGIGSGTLVWHQAQIREGATLGSNCVVGRGVYIGPGVQIGNNCKIQNHALVYEPSVLGDGVFVGPAVVFTNDTYPRAVNPDGSLKSAADWNPVGVVVEDGEIGRAHV